MHFKRLFIIPFMFSITTATLWAQRWDTSYSIGGFGGINIPLTPSAFKNYSKTRTGFGVELKYNVTDMIAFSVTITYFTFNRNINRIEADYIANNPGSIVVDIEGGKKTFDFFTINLIRYITSSDSRQGVYFIGGGCNIKIEDEPFSLSAISPSDEINARGRKEHYFGLLGGIGLELTFDGSVVLFFEGLYRHVLSNIAAATWGEELGKKPGHLSFLSLNFGFRFVMD